MVPLFDQSHLNVSAIVPPLGSTAGDGTLISLTIPGGLPVVDAAGLYAWQSSTAALPPVDAVTVRVSAPGKPSFIFRGLLEPPVLVEGIFSGVIYVRVAPMPVGGVYHVSVSSNGGQFFPSDPVTVSLADDGSSFEFFAPFQLRNPEDYDQEPFSGPSAGGVNASALTRLVVRAPNFPDSLTFDEYVCCRFRPAQATGGSDSSDSARVVDVCFSNAQFGKAEFVPKSRSEYGESYVVCYPPPLPVSTGQGQDSEYFVFVALNGQDFGDTGTMRYSSNVTYRSLACPAGLFAASYDQYVVFTTHAAR